MLDWTIVEPPFFSCHRAKKIKLQTSVISSLLQKKYIHKNTIVLCPSGGGTFDLTIATLEGGLLCDSVYVQWQKNSTRGVKEFLIAVHVSVFTD